MIIQTTSPSSAGGQTQASTPCRSGSESRKERTPATPMNKAGATAHRCGWSVNPTDNPASSAHPNPKATRTPPARMFSRASRNGAATATDSQERSGRERTDDNQPDGSAAPGFLVAN